MRRSDFRKGGGERCLYGVEGRKKGRSMVWIPCMFYLMGGNILGNRASKGSWVKLIWVKPIIH